MTNQAGFKSVVFASSDLTDQQFGKIKTEFPDSLCVRVGVEVAAEAALDLMGGNQVSRLHLWPGCESAGGGQPVKMNVNLDKLNSLGTHEILVFAPEDYFIKAPARTPAATPDTFH